MVFAGRGRQWYVRKLCFTLRVVTDAYQTIWQYYLPDTRFVVQFAKQADELNNPFHIFRFTIPAAPLDSPVPRSGPYLFHGAAVQNQFPHFSRSPVVPPAVPSSNTRTCRDIDRILWKKRLLLRINIAKVKSCALL